MQEVYFNILGWSAWAPDINSLEDWQLWAEDKKAINPTNATLPSISNVPAMQLRRLSSLTKMSLKVALESAGNEKIESVFASRYGELNQTLQLLYSIANNEEVSPAGFSLSVHNTAAGVYSVISKNTASYTAIAAGENTFIAALIEALGKLQNKEKILLIVAEEELPEIYRQIFPEPITQYAVGLLLGKSTNDIKLKLSASTNSTPPIHALDFLKWLLAGKNSVLQMPLFELTHA